MIRRATACSANSGTSSVVTFIPYCGRSNGAKNSPWISRPKASPIAAGAAPRIRNSVDPRIRCTSDTPTGAVGRTWKNTKVAAVASAPRAASDAPPCARRAWAASLSA